MLALVGAVMSGRTPAPAMLSGQSSGPKETTVFFHFWWGAALGTSGFTAKTSRRRVLTSLLEVSSELPPYMTYSFLRHSSPLESDPET